MKFYLLAFLIVLTTISCKKSNTTSTAPADRKLPFVSTAFINMPDPENSSLLRRKLLNIIFNQKYVPEQKFNEANAIKNDDLFKLSSSPYNYQFSPDKNEKYMNNKMNSAEVVVSYHDHMEVHFVPAGLAKEKVIDDLGINLKNGNRIFWINSTDEYLQKNKCYFLAIATLKQIKENDVFFYSEINNIGPDFNEKYYSFSANQIIHLKLSPELYERESVYVTLRGKAKNCKASDFENGCEECHYQREISTANLIKKTITEIALIDVDVIINGKKTPLAELLPVHNADGSFTVALDLKKMGITDTATVEIHQNTQYPVYKNVAGVNFTAACISQDTRNTIDVTPKMKVGLDMNVLGRNLGNL